MTQKRFIKTLNVTKDGELAQKAFMQLIKVSLMKKLNMMGFMLYVRI